MLQTPVLLITFNRPKHTQKVFDAIKMQKPKQLFVFQDGHREGIKMDIEKCKEVRSIFDEPLDWDCELHTYFSTVNLGCGKGPSTAISWFFSQVQQGIILEDDCIPHQDFFYFCHELLNRYSNNEKISFIGGTNYQDGIKRGDGSYYFSSGHHGTWGWASWSRSWQNFDYYLEDFSKKEFNRITKKYFVGLIMREYWNRIFALVKKDRLQESCWDYQFYFHSWRKNMLAIIPNSNLVSNIGDDDDAVHTKSGNILLKRNTSNLMPLKHPKNIYQDKKADLYLHKNYIEPHEYGLSGLKRLHFRVNKRLKAIFNVEGSWFN